MLSPSDSRQSGTFDAEIDLSLEPSGACLSAVGGHSLELVGSGPEPHQLVIALASKRPGGRPFCVSKRAAMPLWE